MKHEDIIKLAQEVGFEKLGRDIEGWVCFTEEIEAFANLVAAHKAEVAIAEAYRCGHKDGMEAAAVICENLAYAATIRARGNT